LELSLSCTGGPICQGQRQGRIYFWSPPVGQFAQPGQMDSGLVTHRWHGSRDLNWRTMRPSFNFSDFPAIKADKSHFRSIFLFDSVRL
jgi:hypothetical protein